MRKTSRKTGKSRETADKQSRASGEEALVAGRDYSHEKQKTKTNAKAPHEV